MSPPSHAPNHLSVMRPQQWPRTSSLLPPPTSPSADELTWLNFLRTAGGTIHDPSIESNLQERQPSSSSVVARNLQQDYEEGHNIVYNGISQRGVVQPLPGHSQDTLAAMSASCLRRFLERQAGRVSLPRWQPDAQVSKCPVCDAVFTFWYRKHHCRKCGRVVCSPCSPHRINIPRRFVIRSPNASIEDPTGGESASSISPNNAEMETVRVCDSCMYLGDIQQDNSSQERRRDGLDNDNVFRGGHRSETVLRPFPRSREAFPNEPQPANTFSQSLPHNGTSVPIHPGTMPRGLPPPPSAIFAGPHGHRHTSSTHAHLGRPQEGSSSGPFHSHRNPIPFPSFPPNLTRPRLLLREEDECPVCGVEMPPGEEVRSAHIEACIATRFSAPQSSTSAVTEQPSPDTSPLALQDRPRGASFRSRGMAMAVYRATEKDCINEAGETQECIICFEEFEQGDEMGRMECLCRFHRACIRQWWDTKGAGSCPTHRLQE